MPGGGFYGFVTYGAQNTLLSANPDMSYFYKVFRKYTHYFEESFTIAVDGPNELAWDRNTFIRAKIPRNADLLRDLYLIFTIPDIFSKFVDPNIRFSQYEFAWSKYLGCRLIENIAIFVGGQKIQEFDGTYMVAKANLDMDEDTRSKWEYLVGHLPDLYDPANGAYSGGLTARSIQGQYPTVFQNPTLASGAQLNRPSIFGRDIYVPLPFWFTEDPSLSLPLCALQLQEVELQITLRPIQELYTILDPSGYRVAPGYIMNAPNSNYQNGIPTYISDPQFTPITNDPRIRNFLVDIGSTTPTLDIIPYQPRVFGTYVYLSDEERAVFATTQLTYLTYQIKSYNFPSEFKRNYLQLEIHNPITRLITIPRRSDAISYRNDEFNWTNWISDIAPFIGTPGLTPPNSTFNTSGLLVPQGQQDIIRTLSVLCDGNALQDDRTAEYFRKLVPYKYYKGKNNISAVPYPFSLKNSPVQPSGSINSSRIKNFQVDLNPYPLPPNTTYLYDITVYIESINWVVISNGTGGLKYAL